MVVLLEEPWRPSRGCWGMVLVGAVDDGGVFLLRHFHEHLDGVTRC